MLDSRVRCVGCLFGGRFEGVDNEHRICTKQLRLRSILEFPQITELHHSRLNVLNVYLSTLFLQSPTQMMLQSYTGQAPCFADGLS